MATVEIGTHGTTEREAGEGDHKAIFITQKWYVARNNYTKLHTPLLTFGFPRHPVSAI